MKESEWKKFKRLKDICLDRFCVSVLGEAETISGQKSKSNHDRYGDLYQLMRDRNRELRNAFDGLSRTQAHIQLMMMYRMGLVKEEELDEFEPETKDHIRESLRLLNS